MDFSPIVHDTIAQNQLTGIITLLVCLIAPLSLFIYLTGMLNAIMKSLK